MEPILHLMSMNAPANATCSWKSYNQQNRWALTIRFRIPRPRTLGVLYCPKPSLVLTILWLLLRMPRYHLTPA